MKKSPNAFVGFEDVIVQGPVEPGLYVASGSAKAVQEVSDSLVDLLWFDSLTPLSHAAEISGARGRQAVDLGWSRGHFNGGVRRPASRVRPSLIGHLIWIDSGHSFDPGYLAAAARQRSLDPGRILRAIEVFHPYSTSQFEEMLAGVPLPAQWSAQQKTLAWTPLVVISDLMAFLYRSDDSTSGRLRRLLRQLSAKAVVLGLLGKSRASRGQEHLVPELLREAKIIHSNSVDDGEGWNRVVDRPILTPVN